MMLSEKAKGKQRAIEPSLGPSSSNPQASTSQDTITRDFVIRFTEGGIIDFLVTVRKEDIVRDVKKKIRQARPELNNRRLRLIHSGQLLTDNSHLLSHFTTLEERQKKGSDEDSSPGPSGTAWLHCSVGPSFEPGEEENDDGRTQTGQIRPQRGFDRLTSMGFSEADIANFRRQFHSRSLMNYLDLNFETEEEYDEYARSLEEQWIDSLDSASTTALSQPSTSSSSSSVLQGIVVGFFFPILPFFFMRNQSSPVFWEDGSPHDPTPNVILSESMQVGLVVGFLVNILFGLWRFVLNTS
ncbi:hypothetical protein M378DRAFT_10484 [Amanita muscaria Koide BX008]|uniref:Ubiquitin-like domain-containing protein n=1 Tax=Amanita muscaria (strain Koide BX008) TaxID=946122 RepID=A0A0C2TG82_AMAMK|nr:hypothetical protein M378DRAFT_10484 [Amanita muscaria Koide BX008]